MQLTEEEIVSRMHVAAELREQGFNCAQCVFASCADLYGIDRDTALRLSASFGGGIGMMRQTCGAACGMFMLAGLETGNAVPNQPQAKKRNYEFVQHLAAGFVEQNGSLICGDLLGLNGKAPMQKRPCKEMITDATRQYLTSIQEKSL